MLDALMYLTVILSFCFPALPWLAGTRWSRRGVWWSTGIALVTLGLFTPLFFSACVATNCGQGAIAIFVLGPTWIGSALLTLTSAALAHFWFAR